MCFMCRYETLGNLNRSYRLMRTSGRGNVVANTRLLVRKLEGTTAIQLSSELSMPIQHCVSGTKLPNLQRYNEILTWELGVVCMRVDVLRWEDELVGDRCGLSHAASRLSSVPLHVCTRCPHLVMCCFSVHARTVICSVRLSCSS